MGAVYYELLLRISAIYYLLHPTYKPLTVPKISQLFKTSIFKHKIIFLKNGNFESFLSATGVPFIPRKMMVSVRPSVNISKDGDLWTVTFNILFKSFSIQFELGKTFVEENPVSKEINKCLAEEDNGTLLIKTTHEKSGAVTTRKFCPTDEGFTVIFHAENGNVNAQRFFKRV